MIQPLKKTKKPKKVKTCIDCESEKIYRESRCHTHYRELANKRMKKWIENNPTKYKEYYENEKKNNKLKCKQCGNIGIKHNKNSLFCSRECAFKYWKENNIRKGKNNPSYRNGNYTKNKLKKNSKKTGLHLSACRRYRVNFRRTHDYDFCERCLTTNSLRFETHHIVYASEAPNHKELHNFKNLIYLCIKCHNELHSKKILRNELVKERGLNKLFGKNLTIYAKDKNKTIIS